jgi:medium-chain acyl-[acyl-carrier-protein] hydrolase
MKWVSERDLESDGIRLFCLPHAGSGAAGFYRWKRLLPEPIRVCPVLPPGREVRLAETPLLRIEQVVDGLQAEVGPLLRETPYAIFGHSMGALLAFEWARRIAEHGLPEPHMLFVSGRNAPRISARRVLHRLPDEAFVEALQHRYGGVPDGFLEDAELREVFLPILRADLEVVETYAFEAGGALRCPVMSLAGEQDGSVSEIGLAAWAETTSGPFSSRRIMGDHFFHLGAGQAELLQCNLAGGPS